MKVQLEKFEQALNSLHGAIEPLPRNDRERDGAIQRFEYTFETAWRTAQKNLKIFGVDAASPRDVIREMGRLGWISTVEDWFDFLDRRNLTSHTYDQQTAEKVWGAIPRFYREAEKLLERFRTL